MTLGLGYDGALDLPYGELLDLIACEQIKHEGFTPIYRETEADFWTLLERE